MNMEGKGPYPVLEVNLPDLYNNTRVMVNHCGQRGISVAGVVKAVDGSLPIARALHDGGCAQLASSRLIHLQRIKERMPDCQTMLLRIPMLSEVQNVVRWCDMSLNSQAETLRSLDQAAARLHKRHGVVLMLDVGDLREGVTGTEELRRLALLVEREMPGLQLLGVGTSLSCYGSILPSQENLGALVQAAGEVEQALGRKLDLVSGGSSTSLLLMQNEGIPKGINHLRIGTSILNPEGIRRIRGIEIPGLREQSMVLQAELVEVGRKPTRPYGQPSVNWSGQPVDFPDRGIQRRAIAALGSQDIGDHHQLVPLDPGVKVLGGSSDHTILDLEHSPREWRVGDVVTFGLQYTPLLYAFCTRHIHIRMIGDGEPLAHG